MGMASLIHSLSCKCSQVNEVTQWTHHAIQARSQKPQILLSLFLRNIAIMHAFFYIIFSDAFWNSMIKQQMFS